jgi:hypothetical protein
MTKKVLASLVISVGILVAGVGVAYAFGTFKANQEGYRQAGSSQASRLTIRVEAGMADPTGDFVPDDPNGGFNSRGGDLNFSIKNTNNVPMRVTSIAQSTNGCATTGCTGVVSNKNNDGTFVSYGTGGSCYQWVLFNAPTNFDNWPTIAPHGTLQVNGSDTNRLGAGMIHLVPTTPQGCQGATFSMQLNVSAVEATYPSSVIVQP